LRRYHIPGFKDLFPLRFQYLNLTKSSSDLLFKGGKILLDFGMTRRVGVEGFLPFLNSFDSVQTGSSDIVETTSERTLAVDSVSVDCDRIEAVRTRILSSSDQIFTDNGTAKDLTFSVRFRRLFCLTCSKAIIYVRSNFSLDIIGMASFALG